ncbi:MAG: 2-hydroxyacyl-CoA dehydratase family protein [Thermofilaceae archaeon]|nr:2-hydroxyacyl-CoA dehydratase family protein [Thermofilaceae archaeon]MCX8179998.1 2-hydroxyacyl-CoA dehydratase family protein [Thermofilaceae archaeon]MDW8004696.1 hypothetical protein [Thermofilaceae archaeon]
MSTLSVVISLRVPRKLKEELEELGVDYVKEMKVFLEELAKRKKAEQVKLEMDKLRESIGKVEGNKAVEFIREDRDERQ